MNGTSDIRNGTCINQDSAFLTRMKIANTIIWSLIAISGILANGTVLVVMFMASKLTSATQYFIINLALSDLIFLTICPSFLIINNQINIYKYMPVLFGTLICKLDYFLTHLTVFITCLTLMSMTFDRYQVIMYPLRSMTFRTTTKAVLTNVFIWIISIILCLPFLYYRVVEYSENSNSSECWNSDQLDVPIINTSYAQINLDQMLLIYKISISYMIPLFTIIICYVLMIIKLRQRSKLLRQDGYDQQKRRRVLMMIGIVSILFGLCWGPIHLIHILFKFYEEFNYCSEWLFAFKSLSHTLTFLSSMLNPFFYTIIGNNFRKQVSEQRLKYSSKFRSYKYRNPSINTNNLNYTNSRRESFELNVNRNVLTVNGSVKNDGRKRLSFLMDK